MYTSALTFQNSCANAKKKRPTKVSKVRVANDAASAAAELMLQDATVVMSDVSPSQDSYKRFAEWAGFSALRAQGPVEGFVSKFKLLCYMQVKITLFIYIIQTNIYISTHLICTRTHAHTHTHARARAHTHTHTHKIMTNSARWILIQNTVERSCVQV